MGYPEEPQYQQYEGKCRQCDKQHTYSNSVKRHPDNDICRECEEANRHPLSDEGVYRLLQKLRRHGVNCFLADGLATAELADAVKGEG